MSTYALLLLLAGVCLSDPQGRPSYTFPGAQNTQTAVTAGRPTRPFPQQPLGGGGRPAVTTPSFNSGGQSLGQGQTQGQNMPQIQSLDVACSKDQMVIRLQFDRPFPGVIYSKGFFNQPNCVYVRPNTNRDFYEFTIRLDSCGSQFVDQFQAGGEAYLENVIIFQNEPGFQEVWDTARRIRCLWAGNLEKVVTSSLNVDMLDQQIVTFSGDTANAFMDVQIGRGPFAPSATGLVKIGETLTLVISVDGDDGFDIHVKECIAHPGDRNNNIQLTDNRGCVLKQKLLTAFQTSQQTGSSGASILSYAFLQAFKFPDQMDVYLECNVELCKGQCNQCPDGQVGRRKREILSNITQEVSDPVLLGRTIRVVSPDDISLSDEQTTITIAARQRENEDSICMSTPGFVTGLAIVLLLLVVSCIMTAVLCIRSKGFSHHHHHPAAYPSSSFLAYSNPSLSSKS